LPGAPGASHLGTWERRTTTEAGCRVPHPSLFSSEEWVPGQFVCHSVALFVCHSAAFAHVFPEGAGAFRPLNPRSHSWGFSPGPGAPSFAFFQRRVGQPPTLPAPEEFFREFPRKIAVSRPSTPKNPPNSHQPNHINLKNSWHSSFPPTRIIKAVEMRERSPAHESGFFCLPLRQKRRRLSLPMVYENAHLAPFFPRKSGFRGAFSEG
jgi:hypothetical protein